VLENDIKEDMLFGNVLIVGLRQFMCSIQLTIGILKYKAVALSTESRRSVKFTLLSWLKDMPQPKYLSRCVPGPLCPE
jgi:hypothetical protein